jgi:hypothetical protein
MQRMEILDRSYQPKQSRARAKARANDVRLIFG